MNLKFFVSALVGAFLCASCALSAGDTAEYLMNEYGSQVVMLTPPDNHFTGGTGFELALPSGRVVTITNAHVCGLAKEGMLAARIADERWVNVAVREVATTTDLCIVEPIPGATGFPLAPSAPMRTAIWTLGHPHLRPLTPSHGYMLGRSVIEISEPDTDADHCNTPDRHMAHEHALWGDVDMCVRAIDSVEINALTLPGNSGSPMVNARGQVEGVVFAADSGDGHGFAIPLDVLRTFVLPY